MGENRNRRRMVFEKVWNRYLESYFGSLQVAALVFCRINYCQLHLFGSAGLFLLTRFFLDQCRNDPWDPRVCSCSKNCSSSQWTPYTCWLVWELPLHLIFAYLYRNGDRLLRCFTLYHRTGSDNPRSSISLYRTRGYFTRYVWRNGRNWKSKIGKYPHKEWSSFCGE